MSLPHLPATCAKCFDKLTPAEKAIALIVRRLVLGAAAEDVWAERRATPLCELVDTEHVQKGTMT